MNNTTNAHGTSMTFGPGYATFSIPGQNTLNIGAFLQQAFGNPQQMPDMQNHLLNLFNVAGLGMAGNPGDYVFGQRGLDDIISNRKAEILSISEYF